MLPFRAQRAAQAIEDGAVLAACPAEIGRFGYSSGTASLRVFAIIPDVASPGRLHGKQNRFHLSDGPQQRTRDAQPGDASAEWFLKAIAWVYGHDAEAIVDVGRRGTPNISRTLSSR